MLGNESKKDIFITDHGTTLLADSFKEEIEMSTMTTMVIIICSIEIRMEMTNYFNNENKQYQKVFYIL